MKRSEIFDLIDDERLYQDDKWGADRALSLWAWLTIAERELLEARSALIEDNTAHAKSEILQAVAVLVAALEWYGVQHEASHAAKIEELKSRSFVGVDREAVELQRTEHIRSMLNGLTVLTNRSSELLQQADGELSVLAGELNAVFGEGTDAEREQREDERRNAFLAGARTAAWAWAISKDGEQKVGCMQTPLKEVLDELSDPESRTSRFLFENEVEPAK